MAYMYILECADGSYYTGSTKDLDRRLWEHQNGLGANHTAMRLPVKLVYYEECDRIDDAFYREKQVQGWSRKKKEALMASDTNQLHLLAECRNESHYGNAGFDHFGYDLRKPEQHRDDLDRSLSGVEGNNVEACN
jgi:putative endonuclease